jgi:hypothetical protein
VDTFVDHGVSGSREKRPALDRMMADAKKDRFDIPLVWRSDRLFRSLRHTTVAELSAGPLDDALLQGQYGNGFHARRTYDPASGRLQNVAVTKGVSGNRFASGGAGCSPCLIPRNSHRGSSRNTLKKSAGAASGGSKSRHR